MQVSQRGRNGNSSKGTLARLRKSFPLKEGIAQSSFPLIESIAQSSFPLKEGIAQSSSEQFFAMPAALSFARTYTYSFFDLFAYFFVCHFGQTARILSIAFSVFSRVLKAVKRT